MGDCHASSAVPTANMDAVCSGMAAQVCLPSNDHKVVPSVVGPVSVLVVDVLTSTEFVSQHLGSNNPMNAYQGVRLSERV